jgi:hypothetical protein
MRKILVRLAPLGALLALWPMSALAAGWFLASQPQFVMPEPGGGSMVLAGVLGIFAVMRRRLGS